MAKTKALISCAVTAQLTCVFVFAYAKCWFSHAKVHIVCKVNYFECILNCMIECILCMLNFMTLLFPIDIKIIWKHFDSEIGGLTGLVV